MTRRTAYTPGRWAKKVPDMLRADGQPDTTAHAVLAALATYADKDGTNARPSVSTLAADTRFNVDTVQDALDTIVANELISKDGELTGGTIVWRLHLEVVGEGPSVHDRREEQRRASDAARQRRARRHRAGDHSLCQPRYCEALQGEDRHGLVHRDRHGAPDRDVTALEPVTSRHEHRDVTVPGPVSHGARTVTPAGQTGYTTPDQPIDHPFMTTSRTPRPSRKRREEPTDRPDVEALCARLHERVVANGFKATISATWRQQARLLLDEDGWELDKALALIDWATSDSFWRANIRSMPTFREKYNQLRLRATEDWRRRHTATPAGRAEGWQAMKTPGPAAVPSRADGWQAMKTQAPLAATGTEGGLPLLYPVPDTPRALPRGGSQ